MYIKLTQKYFSFPFFYHILFIQKNLFLQLTTKQQTYNITQKCYLYNDLAPYNWKWDNTQVNATWGLIHTHPFSCSKTYAFWCI